MWTPFLVLYVLSRPHAAAAKSLQSCPTLCDPIDSSPPGSSVPGILQARTLEWGAIAFSASPHNNPLKAVSFLSPLNGSPFPYSCLENPMDEGA